MRAKLQRSQEIQDVLLRRCRKRIEIGNDFVCLRAARSGGLRRRKNFEIRLEFEYVTAGADYAVGGSTGVCLYRLHEVRCAAIMQEEQALAKAPERCRAKLVRACGALLDAIGKRRAHVVDGEIRIRMVGRVGHARVRRRGSRERRRVTKVAAYGMKQSLTICRGPVERRRRGRSR